MPPKSQLGLLWMAAGGQAAVAELIAAAQPGAGIHLLLEMGIA